MMIQRKSAAALAVSAALGKRCDYTHIWEFRLFPDGFLCGLFDNRSPWWNDCNSNRLYNYLNAHAYVFKILSKCLRWCDHVADFIRSTAVRPTRDGKTDDSVIEILIFRTFNSRKHCHAKYKNTQNTQNRQNTQKR